MYVGEAEEFPDEVAPVCHPKQGRGLTTITCPWIQFRDVGEAGESQGSERGRARLSPYAGEGS